MNTSNIDQLEFPPPRDFDCYPYRRSRYVGNAARRNGASYAKRNARSNQHRLDSVRSIGIVGMLGLTGLALCACLAFSEIASNAFGWLGSSIDSTLGSVFASDKSTPASDWKKGSVPYLYQTDAQWAESKYADGKISDYGCGPTCMSMVYISLTGNKNLTPDALGKFSEQNGFVEQGMTSWRFMSEGAKMLGLSATEIGADAIIDSLGRGRPIICSVRPGDFTTVGHFIVLAGVNSDGSIDVRDPNSADRSHKSWDADRIISQCNNLWAYSI